jgi:probable addiction module antidote protein
MKVFDITRHLDSEEAMAEYLSQVLEDGDSDELIRALDHIAKARGLTPSQK